MIETCFSADDKRCIGCGMCINICPGGVLYLNMDKKPRMIDITEFGWNGCWKCEHCLAVCPRGAISIFGKRPADSIPPVSVNEGSALLDSLIANRRSCRRYLNKNVPADVIDGMISQLAMAPNGGNKEQVEYTVIDDKDQMDIFRHAAYSEMDRLAALGIYPKGFDADSYNDMKRWESTVRPDMLFCGAPHILIPHAPLGKGEPIQDVLIAGTYFELLCASRGLGAIMMTFPLDTLENMPEIKKMLGIPDDHYTGMVIGFGYPEIKYARGVQKTVDNSRIHRLTFEKEID